MFRLIYTSTASHLLAKHELLDILNQAREKNRRLGVTGMLLYKGGNFMQLLEGDEPVVRELYETIRRDPRHHRAIVLLKKPADERMFADWTMGFKDLGDPDVEAMPGFAPFRNISLTSSNLGSDAEACLNVLRFFRDTR